MVTRQTVARKDGHKQAATARRLLQGSTMAQHVLDATFYDERIDVPVIRCKAERDFVKGNVNVTTGQRFFLVQSSKFKHYYYVVAFNAERKCYQCSCGANTLAHRHITLAKQHAFELVKKEVA